MFKLIKAVGGIACLVGFAVVFASMMTEVSKPVFSMAIAAAFFGFIVFVLGRMFDG